MRRFQTILLLLVLFALPFTARATTMTIAAVTVPDWTYGGTTAKLRIWASEGFFDSNGGMHFGGQVGNLSNVFMTVNCTVSGTTLTIPSFTLPSTVDSPDRPNVRYTAVIYDSKGTRRDTFFSLNNYRVPISMGTGTNLTWLQIRTFNNIAQRPPNDTYPTTQQMVTAINAAQPCPTSGNSVKGCTKLSVVPADTTNPIAVGDNDPRLSTVTTVLTCAGLDDTTPLLAAIAAGGTIAITRGTTCAASSSITFPSTVTLRIDRGGLLKPITGQSPVIQGSIDAGAYQIFTNATAGLGTVLITSTDVLEVFPQWWGASRTASAGTNTAALQAMIYGAQGAVRTNGSGDWIYNRIVTFTTLFDINDELRGYHWIGFYWRGNNRFNSGIRQTGVNKRIIDGQSVAYGMFFNLMIQGSVASNEPLLDLDYDGSQGSDLRPQNITIEDCVVQNNAYVGNFATGYIGIQIAKSGSGAQGDNVRIKKTYINGFQQAGLQIGGGADGVATAPAQNAIEVELDGGDIQGCRLFGVAVYGGSINIRNSTFENGNVTFTDGASQLGYDLFATASAYQNTVENVRSESLRFASGNWNIKNCTVLGPQITFAATWPNIPGSSSFLNQLVTGSVYGGDGKMYLVTGNGTFGGLATTTATGGSLTSIVKAGAGWATDEFAAQRATIMSGSGKYQYCLIDSNDATTLNCPAGWQTDYKLRGDTGLPVVVTAPDSTSTFLIEPDWPSNPTSSGSVTFALLDIVTLGNADTFYPLSGNIEGFRGGLGTRIYYNGGDIKAAAFSRSDWFESNAKILDDTYIKSTFDKVLIQRYGAAENEYVSWSIPRNGLTPSFTDYSYKQVGRQAQISSAGDAGGGSGYLDVGWGRGDGIAWNDASAVSRNIFAYFGILGCKTVSGSNQAGIPCRRQGGLSTGSGTEGSIEEWLGATGSTGSAVNAGTKVSSYTRATGFKLFSIPLQVSTTSALPTSATVDIGAILLLGNIVPYTPTQDTTINIATVPTQEFTLLLVTSGTSSFTITFGTNFKTTGTLATGTVSAKVFTIHFVCDGTRCAEVTRSPAM
jgi:hypothetical protein